MLAIECTRLYEQAALINCCGLKSKKSAYNLEL